MQSNATSAVLDAGSSEVLTQPSPITARIEVPAESAVANDAGAAAVRQRCVDVLALSMKSSAAGF